MMNGRVKKSSPITEARREIFHNIGDTKNNLSGVVNEVTASGSCVIVEKSGLPAVAIISLDEYRRFKIFEEERKMAWNALARISGAFEDVPLDELEAEVDRVVGEVRAEMREERTKNR